MERLHAGDASDGPHHRASQLGPVVKDDRNTSTVQPPPPLRGMHTDDVVAQFPDDPPSTAVHDVDPLNEAFVRKIFGPAAHLLTVGLAGRLDLPSPFWGVTREGVMAAAGRPNTRHNKMSLFMLTGWDKEKQVMRIVGLEETMLLHPPLHSATVGRNTPLGPNHMYLFAVESDH